MISQVRTALIHTFPKHLLIDLYDMVVARALAAYEMVRDHARLDEKRARELVGQARFRMLEKGFQEVCELHGGIRLQDDLIPGTDLRVFQPFMRFQGPEIGVIFGLASMPERRAVPSRNQSRSAGVTLNYDLVPRFDFDGSGPKPGDIFVLFLVARDPTRAGKVDEVAIGLVNSAYVSFMLYEPIEEFLAGYATDPGGGPPSPAPTLVTLKRTPKPFVPPEVPSEDTGEEGSSTA